MELRRGEGIGDGVRGCAKRAAGGGGRSMGGWPIWILAAKILLKLHEAAHVSSLLGYPRTMAAYSLNWDNQTFLKYGISHLAY